MLEWQLLHQKSSDQYSWHIAGSLILISVFLFSKDVGWEALATKPYTDVLLALNWQTQKQWERWLIALFTSLAQTLKRNRFWRYTCVISADVNTGVNTSWTELWEIYWPIRLTNSGLGSAFFVLSSIARFVWVCMKYIHMRYWPSVRSKWLDIGRDFFLFFYVFRNGDEVSVQKKKWKKNEANIQDSLYSKRFRFDKNQEWLVCFESREWKPTVFVAQ